MNRKTGICYVVGAGENYGIDFTPCGDDFVIAVDGGFRVLEQSGIRMDLVIGDFDSLNFIPAGHEPGRPSARVMVLSREKDDTDMRAAILEGIKTGYEAFHIYGGTGGRIEHTIANIQLLAELSLSGKRGFLFGKDYVITALTNGTFSFPAHISGYLSVFAHSDRAEGVWLEGLKYELQDAVLTNSYPLGVSNEFIGKKSSICVENGTLILVFQMEAKEKK